MTEKTVTALQENDPRIQTILDTITDYTLKKFDKKVSISENMDRIDAIATGINVLGEELQSNYLTLKTQSQLQRRLEDAQRIAKIGNWELEFATNNLYWSKEHYDIFEIPYDTPNETLYSVYRSKILPEDLAKLDPLMEKSIQTGQPFEFIHRIELPNQPIKYIRGLGNVTFGLQGEILGIQGTAQDITEYHQKNRELIAAKEEIEKFFDLSQDFMGVANTNGYWVTINQTFEKVLGYTSEEMKSTPFLELIHPDDKACTGKEVEKLAQGALTIDFENRYRRKDGTYVWISWRAAPDVSSGNLYCTGRNINAIKTQEKERMYTIQLEKDKEIAEQKTKVKERFLANMSHEIRTPMNSILGLSNLMEKVGTLNPKQMDYMKTIKLNSKNLLNIINDILDLSKIEEGKLEIEQVNFDIKELVQNVRKSLDLVAHKKKIQLTSTIDVEIPNLLLGDSTRLNQVLLNLTNNAIKFTHEGSVQLNLKLLSKEDHQVRLRFEIKDTGIGIEADRIHRIFDPFSQEKSSTTRLYGGTGLGLSISNQIIHALHSEIHVESEPNVGSTFYFELTFQLASTMDSPNNFEIPMQTTELIGNYRILLVEDNPFNQMVAEDTLKDWHGELEIDIAENGLIALEKFQQNSYDLVLMDIQMPEMDGHEATKKARNEYGIRIPILAMTAQATPSEIEACIQSGMNDYISKPFKEEDLFSKITYWLQTDFLK